MVGGACIGPATVPGFVVDLGQEACMNEDRRLRFESGCLLAQCVQMVDEDDLTLRRG